MSFKQLTTQDKVISTDAITGTVWSGNAPTLTTMFTSSVQDASNTGQYYLHVYQTGSNLSTSAVQFDIAYADQLGSGSLFYNNQVTGSLYLVIILHLIFMLYQLKELDIKKNYQ